jgi:SNF2 family DNA or RNA helicase
MKLKSTTTPQKQSKALQEKWQPHKYQTNAVKRGIQQAALALFLDPGLGKTSIFLAIVKLLKKEKLISKVLVIAPLRVCYLVWPKEVQKWIDFNGLTVQILHGKDKEKNLLKEADIYLINPEGLTWLVKHNLRKLGFDMLGIDESSKFKAANTQRFKLLKGILPIFRRRIIMTGSPTPNSMMDLFSQIFILDGGAALGRFITHYRNQFFYPTGFQGYDWALIPGMEKVIQDKIKPLVLRLEAKDHLELPQLIENNIYVELGKDARAAYEEMEDELFVAMDDGDIEAVNAAAASIKCRQIANGGVYDEDSNAHHLHMEKAEAVKELIEELNGVPAFVAYDFAHDLHRLMKVLGKNTPNISTASPKMLPKIEADWNAGKIPVLLGHPASVAHGLNLQGSGNHVIWHSLTWNFENYDQFNKRVWRQGNKNSYVYVHHIIAENTVDIAVLTALKFKDNSQKSLLAGLKEYKKIINRK